MYMVQDKDSSGEVGVVSIFCENMLKDMTPHIFGDGTNTRNFIYVEDVAEANYIALTKLDSQICNVCSSTETSV